MHHSESSHCNRSTAAPLNSCNYFPFPTTRGALFHLRSSVIVITYLLINQEKVCLLNVPFFSPSHSFTSCCYEPHSKIQGCCCCVLSHRAHGVAITHRLAARCQSLNQPLSLAPYLRTSVSYNYSYL